ncbi:MAG: RNA methyltransferase [Flavobacteriales bacterium]
MTDIELYEQLSAFISENKRSLFDRIAPLRTRHVTVVLEDIYQSQNASAVLRTCDLVGVQDVHVIENRNSYKVDQQVALGSSQWVDIIPYRTHEDNTRACMDALRAKGYRIIATSPRGDANTPHDIDLQQPMAFCFGTELTGLSDTLINEADAHLRIPMYGFTESYNISVSAAITLFTVMERLRNSTIDWRLDESASLALRLQWVRTVLQSAELIEARLRNADRSDDAM